MGGYLMHIDTLDLIYKLFIGGMVVLVAIGTYLNISEYRSITKWEKENN